MLFASPLRPSNRARLPLIALAIAISACASGAVPEPAGAALTQDGRGQAVLSDQLDDSRWPSDPITVEKASVSGNTLDISVSHGGGCTRAKRSFVAICDSVSHRGRMRIGRHISKRTEAFPFD